MMPKESLYGPWPNSGEIDIMEFVGYNPGVIHGSIHTKSYYWKIGTQKTGTINVADCSEEFHVYAIEWFPDRIDFHMDETNYFSFTKENSSFKKWPFNQDFYFILNIAVGGIWGGSQGIDNSIFPQQMLVDYVRGYQLK